MYFRLDLSKQTRWTVKHFHSLLASLIGRTVGGNGGNSHTSREPTMHWDTGQSQSTFRLTKPPITSSWRVLMPPIYRTECVGRLTHWGRVTHICVSKLTIIGSDNGLSPDRRQAILWTNAGLLLIEPLGTNFSEILIEILTFSFKKMHLKVSSAKRRPFCLGLNVLNGNGPGPRSYQCDTTERYHDINFVVICGTRCCRYDNPRRPIDHKVGTMTVFSLINLNSEPRLTYKRQRDIISDFLYSESHFKL